MSAKGSIGRNEISQSMQPTAPTTKSGSYEKAGTTRFIYTYHGQREIGNMLRFFDLCFVHKNLSRANAMNVWKKDMLKIEVCVSFA